LKTVWFSFPPKSNHAHPYLWLFVHRFCKLLGLKIKETISYMTLSRRMNVVKVLAAQKVLKIYPLYINL
jgi:hypothetical protein